MKRYLVLYHVESQPQTQPPFGYLCKAYNKEHAEYQCLEAYQDCCVMYVTEAGDLAPQDAYEDALDEYFYGDCYA